MSCTCVSWRPRAYKPREASSLGRVVVAWRIRQYAWKVQRWTRVVGQMFPVGDDQGWGRDPAHERFPGPGILTPRRIPAQHAIGCLGDEHDGAWAQVDAVNEDDLMNLIDDRAKRP